MWFAGFDWDGILARQVKPPLKPMSKGATMTDEVKTLEMYEAPDVQACPEWFPYLPKTLHNWRESDAPRDLSKRGKERP